MPFLYINAKLLTLKAEVEALDMSGEWEYLKRCSNPYELVYAQSQDSRVPPSVSNLRPLSRSFFKMIEMLQVLDFYKRHGSGVMRTAHVCEGPGGFIEAISHMCTRNSIQLESVWAMTLKPSRPNIPGWKRAYSFLRKSPMVHIEYGADDTGDIMVPANQREFIKKAGGKCHIFTADGGFDFSENYATQEDEVFPLLVSSSLIGLQTLVKGGDFILKIFDTELQCTKDLIALLAYCFDSWTLYKPAMSRPCNAEKYFLGRGCRRVPRVILQALCNIRDSYATTLNRTRGILEPSDSISHVFDQIQSLRSEFQQHQVDALEHAIANRQEWNTQPNKIWTKIHDHSIVWCRHFQIPLKSFTSLSLHPQGQPVELRRRSGDAGRL